MKREIIAACKGFGQRIYTVSQITDLTGFPRHRVRHVLWKLEDSGAITRCRDAEAVTWKKGRPVKEIWYRNTRHLGCIERATAENGWDVMWKTVRILRRFTRTDLAAITGQGMENIRAFTKAYRELGYLRHTKEAGRGVVWALVKDPGPRRPIGGDDVD